MTCLDEQERELKFLALKQILHRSIHLIIWGILVKGFTSCLISVKSLCQVTMSGSCICSFSFGSGKSEFARKHANKLIMHSAQAHTNTKVSSGLSNNMCSKLHAFPFSFLLFCSYKYVQFHLISIARYRISPSSPFYTRFTFGT